MNTPSTLHLVLTHHWYDETVKRVDPKRIEYRAMTARWMRLIYERRDTLKHVRFARGYSKTMATFSITRIDIGPQPPEKGGGQPLRGASNFPHAHRDHRIPVKFCSLFLPI